jgi:hypothetical protein
MVRDTGLELAAGVGRVKVASAPAPVLTFEKLPELGECDPILRTVGDLLRADDVLENLGGQLGTAESHGCIRLADSTTTWLAARVTPGVPITIT